MSLLTPLLFHCHYLSLLHPSALKILLHLLPRSFNSKPLSTLTHQFSPFTLISFHVQLFSAILYSPLNMCLATSRPKFLSLSFLPSFSYNIDFLFVHFVSLYWTGIAQSVKRLATGRTVRGSKKKKSRLGRDFSHQSRSALGPNQPPIQWEPGLFSGDKAAGTWCWPPTPSSAETKERVELYVYSQFGSSWPVLGWVLPLLLLLSFA